MISEDFEARDGRSRAAPTISSLTNRAARRESNSHEAAEFPEAARAAAVFGSHSQSSSHEAVRFSKRKSSRHEAAEFPGAETKKKESRAAEQLWNSTPGFRGSWATKKEQWVTAPPFKTKKK